MSRWRTPRVDRPLSCRKVGKVLQSYLDGATDELTTRRVARHLEDCRRCGLEAVTYQAIKDSLNHQDRDLPDDAVARLRTFSRHLLAEAEPDDPTHHNDVG